ncbi:MAG: isoamylase early set domain-containing protein [Ginsengibacter sp.]
MKKEIIFTLPEEALDGATEVIILGDFNNWTPGKEFELKKQKDGSLKTVVQLEEGKTYQYRFLLNDGRWVNDYHAQNYVPVSGLYIDNCVISVTETLDIEQNQQAESLKPKVESKKESVKVKTSLNAKTSVKTESVVAKVAKEAKAKATGVKTKKAKSATETAKDKNVAKSAKAVKKEITKVKK